MNRIFNIFQVVARWHLSFFNVVQSTRSNVDNTNRITDIQSLFNQTRLICKYFTACTYGLITTNMLGTMLVATRFVFWVIFAVVNTIVVIVIITIWSHQINLRTEAICVIDFVTITVNHHFRNVNTTLNRVGCRNRTLHGTPLYHACNIAGTIFLELNVHELTIHQHWVVDVIRQLKVRVDIFFFEIVIMTSRQYRESLTI